MAQHKADRTNKEVKGNSLKYHSYREAWARISQAQENGYYMEAISIVESIISDRLLSYLIGVGVISIESKEKAERTFFGQLIDQWRKHLKERNEDSAGAALTLVTEIDKWRSSRNQAVHGIVKSFPGDPTIDITEFLTLAKNAASEGERLARAICVWHKRVKNEKVDGDGE